MKILRRIIVLVVILIVLICCVFFVLPDVLGKNHPVTGIIDESKIALTNSAIDATGIKGKAQEALEANSERIAETTGLPLAVVDEAIESLDIESWQVTTLPRYVVEAETLDVDYSGIEAKVTLYDDPSVVTVNAYGQTVTLAVPESSQEYVRYLSMVEAMDPGRIPAAASIS